MIKLAWNSWLNRNNNNFFKQDYNYWKWTHIKLL
jgi:hypothetical protein